jgi:hypothetical protein
MARVDRVKEEIGWLKLPFAALVAIDATLIGWLAQNYASANTSLTVAGLASTVVLTLAVAWVNSVAYRRLEELEAA